MSAVRTVQVTFDCADPRTLAEFWCAALGYRQDPPPQGFASWDEALADWRVPEELWGAERREALEAEASRLVLLGATRVRRQDPDATPGEIGYVVMQDPEGNEFCLD